MGLILTLLVHFKTKAVVARQSWGFQLMSSGWEDTPDLGKAIQCFPAAMVSGGSLNWWPWSTWVDEWINTGSSAETHA